MEFKEAEAQIKDAVLRSQVRRSCWNGVAHGIKRFIDGGLEPDEKSLRAIIDEATDKIFSEIETKLRSGSCLD